MSSRQQIAMKVLSIVLLLLGVANADDDKPKEVTAAEFDKHIGAMDHALVMFYAPWCGACQEAKPKFESASIQFGKLDESKNSGFRLVNCDDQKNNALCEKFKIEGYPTIKFFTKGKFIQDYEDEHLPENFVNFIKIPPKEGEKRQGSAQHQGVDEEKKEADEAMENVTYLNGDMIKSTLAKTDYAMVFFYAPWCPHCQEAKPKYNEGAKKVAKMHLDGRLMAAVNCDAKENTPTCSELKVEGYPTIRLFHKGEMWQEFEDEITAENLATLMQKPPREKVPPTPVEEEKPEDKQGEKKGEKEVAAESKPEKPEELMKGVVYLNSKNFQDGLKKNPHTLVMFYAPWCPHCVEVKPKVSAAALELAKKGKTGWIAAVNCDAKENEKVCNDENIEGFPTLRHYKGAIKVSDYQEGTGPPSTEGMVKYMDTADKPTKEEL